MKKKLFLISLITFSLALYFSGIAFAENIKIFVDGLEIKSDVPPIIQNGRTMVPIRFISESLGANVQWDSKTKTVTVTKNTTSIKLVIGGKAYKNGQEITLDAPAQVKNGRTMVPLRFISETLNSKVLWDNNNKCVAVFDSEKLHFSLSQAINEKNTILSQITKLKLEYNTQRQAVDANYSSSKAILDNQKEDEIAAIRRDLIRRGIYNSELLQAKREEIEQKYKPYYDQLETNRNLQLSQINAQEALVIQPLEAKIKELDTLIKNIQSILNS